MRDSHRPLTALLLALALVAGLLVPAVFPAGAAAAVATAASPPPCHGDAAADPDDPAGRPSGSEAPCPFMALCAAKCFQSLPQLGFALRLPPPAAPIRISGREDRREGRSPPPLLKVPRVSTVL